MDWVKSCFECSTAMCFRDLRRDIEEDVKVRNAQIVGAQMRFELQTVKSAELDTFRVVRFAPQAQQAVDFSHDGSFILCHAQSWETIKAKPRLNGEGEWLFDSPR